MIDQGRLKVLLVDDDRNIRKTLEVSLSGLGCDVSLSASGEEAIQFLKSGAYDFVLTDFKMSGKSGIDVIQHARHLKPAPVTAVMTAFASFENAVIAIKEGAFDYLPKPFSTQQLAHLLQKVRRLVELERENRALRSQSRRADYFSGMTSPALGRLEEFVEKIADTDSTILMVGESGTGKTELASEIHARSNRAKQPFVVVNCTSLAEALLESELFGHAKGSFTGAVQEHQGKFEAANRGTVFLDEIGDLSLAGQAKLLRVLQERVIERVGSNRQISVDVRVIAATNKNLEEAVHQGRFREDLYYRLNVFECMVVPLRHRREDLPVLIKKFSKEFSDQAIPDPVMKLLLAYDWPGNVRELRNAVERLMILSRGREISVDDLSVAVRIPSLKASHLLEVDRLKTLDEIEREHIERVLTLKSNQEEAAAILGITTVTLWRKRKQYGLR